MKKYLFGLLIIVLLLTVSTPVYACTSFAVYSSKEPIYGLNFDYPDAEVKLRITSSGDIKTLYLCYEMSPGNFGSVDAINNKGLLTTLLAIPSGGPDSYSEDESNINLGQLLEHSSSSLGTVKEANDFIGNRRVTQITGFTSSGLHSLYADKDGNAEIIEVGDKQNEITPIKDKFIVMTNFPVYMFKGKSYKDVTGGGSDRYKTAWEYISRNMTSFDRDKAFKVLESTVQTWSGGGTLTSMVFEPGRNNIYLALHRDFSRIWRISLQDGVIESFTGFSKPLKINIGDNGVLASDLNKAADKAEKATESKVGAEKTIMPPTLEFALIALLLVMALIAFFLIRNRRSKNKHG